MKKALLCLLFIFVFFLTPQISWGAAGSCSNPAWNASKMLCEDQGYTWTADGSTNCYAGGQIYENVSMTECNILKQEAKNQANSITKNPQAQAATQNNNQYFSGNSIPEYIKSIYTYAIGVVGILATVVIMIGGLIWISSMGNAARVNSAKEWIGAALTGLALAMFSYTILYIINPDTVNFRWSPPQQVNTGDASAQNSATTPKVDGCYINNGLCVPTNSQTHGSDPSFVAGGRCSSGNCVTQ